MFDKQHPPPQHFSINLVAVSPSPSILRMSSGLSEMRVVEARRGLLSAKFTKATGKPPSLSTSSSIWGSVMGVEGASESLECPDHDIDSPEDLGEVCSGWVGVSV